MEVSVDGAVRVHHGEQTAGAEHRQIVGEQRPLGDRQLKALGEQRNPHGLKLAPIPMHPPRVPFRLREGLQRRRAIRSAGL